MINPEAYKEARRTESVGGHGSHGIKILVACENEHLIDNDRMQQATYQAEQIIRNALQCEMVLNDPERVQNAEARRRKLIDQFPEPIYVQEIPNEYWGGDHPAGILDPWLLITTKIGVFKVGWRKRVIVLDWEKTDIGTSVNARDTFRGEDTTKDWTSIHCWGYDKLGEYVTALFKVAGHEIVTEEVLECEER